MAINDPILDYYNAKKITINAVNNRRNNPQYNYSPIEKKARGIVVLELLIKCDSLLKTKETLMSEIGISMSTAQKWIKEIMVEIDLEYGSVRDFYKSYNMDRLDKIYGIAMEKNDLRTALATLDQMNKLNGNYVERVDIRQENNVFEFGE